MSRIGARELLLGALLVLALVAGGACAPAAARPRAAQSAAADTCDGAAPSYRAEVEPLLKRYCLRCHAEGGDAGEDHDFTRYEVLHAQRTRFRAVIERGAMPPTGLPHPSPEERVRLSRWACLGAPDN